MKAISKNKAFTLVELLIVIAIIGMLSVLSIAGYTSYRKNALVDFAVESLIAKMHEMKESAIYGVNQEPKCFGLGFFHIGGGDYVIGSFSESFLTNKKQWNNDKMEWVSAGCDYENMPPDANGLATFDIDPMLHVKNIVFYSEGDVEVGIVPDFFVRFLPPDGKIEVYDGNWGDGPNGADYVTIELQYGDGTDLQHRRNLIIQLDGSDINYEMPSNVQ